MRGVPTHVEDPGIAGISRAGGCCSILRITAHSGRSVRRSVRDFVSLDNLSVSNRPRFQTTTTIRFNWVHCAQLIQPLHPPLSCQNRGRTDFTAFYRRSPPHTRSDNLASWQDAVGPQCNLPNEPSSDSVQSWDGLQDSTTPA